MLASMEDSYTEIIVHPGLKCLALAKLRKPLQALTPLGSNHSRQDTATTKGQLRIQQTCPCCSGTLLGDMRLGELY
jgi:hypothetical protein